MPTTDPIRWDLVAAAAAANADPWSHATPAEPRPELTAREQLLAHYANKPINEYVQYDLFHCRGGDGLACDDADGDIAYTATSRELRHGFPVRIYVQRGTDAATAGRLIRKAAEWIVTGGHTFDGDGPFGSAESHGVRTMSYRDAGAAGTDTDAPAATGLAEDDDGAFGTCPDCGKTDGYINIGRAHWFYCAEHRTRWIAGTNLFSSWQDETIDQQRATYERLNFGSFAYIAASADEAAAYERANGGPPPNPTRVREAVPPRVDAAARQAMAEDIHGLATKALGRVQHAQTDPHLYQLLRDVCDISKDLHAELANAYRQLTR